MTEGGPSFFDGLSPAEVEQVVAQLDPRRFAAGAIVIAEGDLLQELYILRSGTADVFATDYQGDRRWITRVGPGATLGEMSLFTGQPASASVFAATDLEVLALSREGFQRTLMQFPRIYHTAAFPWMR